MSISYELEKSKSYFMGVCTGLAEKYWKTEATDSSDKVTISNKLGILATPVLVYDRTARTFI